MSPYGLRSTPTFPWVLATKHDTTIDIIYPQAISPPTYPLSET